MQWTSLHIDDHWEQSTANIECELYIVLCSTITDVDAQQGDSAVDKTRTFTNSKCGLCIYQMIYAH